MRALRRPTISTSLLLLLTLLTTLTLTARAADDDDNKDYDEYDEYARVVRVNYLVGDVQLQRKGSQTWERARVNFPLVEGDVLATTGQDARVEIQIDSRNFVRLAGDSILRVVSLRDEGVALSLSEGTATLRLARFDRKKEYFEIDAPGTTLSAEKNGVYRLDVSREGRVHLTVRGGGQARIYSETSGFTLRDGRTAQLVYNGVDAGDWELSKADSFDSWDGWVDERERFLSARLRYDGRDRYYDQDVWGAEDLDAYGEWIYVGEYGWIWRPNSSSIIGYHDWAPYRYGRWVWCPPYGWTWVGDEPWGWAPYHYGRWVYYNNIWCWVPRGPSHRRAWWRPALVVFVYIPSTYGERVCWYPLGYGQRDPRGRHYRRLEALRSRDLARLHRTNPAYQRAISTLPARDFGRRSAQAQPASAEIARRAVTAEPVRGRLPILPADGSGTNTDAAERRAPRVVATRPVAGGGGGGLAPGLVDRPTGAARRTPGVPLDEELHRTRVYNGREPRVVPGAGENSGGGGSTNGVIDPANTGAVARPPRVRGTESQPAERGNSGNEGNTNAPWFERMGRPTRANPGNESRPATTTTTPPSPGVERPDGGDAQPAGAPTTMPERVRPRRDEGDGGSGGEPISRPSRRPETRPEPQPETRPEPESRPEPRPESRPAPRFERPEPRPESRPEPRNESRPEPRPEPRQESRPEPRQESRPEPRPDPPRSEPRYEAPSQPESRPDPPRSDPPRSEPAPQREEPREREVSPRSERQP
ncbi:MAG TPA: DUF6600 domain-containing protein [Pyrinomonadaceae bacterium]|nr:DUF6600 domain-containing protein [Pyrinomonadaceae bacterium]